MGAGREGREIREGREEEESEGRGGSRDGRKERGSSELGSEGATEEVNLRWGGI